MADSIGFAVRRSYPPDTATGRVLSQEGAPTVVCVIQFVVDLPKGKSGISRVVVHVFPYDRWRALGRATVLWGPEYDFSVPECPSPSSIADYRRAARPLDLSFVEDFIHDASDDRFYREGNVVSGRDILDYVYEYHCRTLRWRFQIKWWLRQGLRSAIQRGVWRGQDLCLWILREGYEVAPVGDDLHRSPFHRFKVAEFNRTTEREAQSHFFGFQSSR